MDLRKLKTLIELVEGSGIAELEISDGEERVRITRTVAAAHQIYACAATRCSGGRTCQTRRTRGACSEIADGRYFLPIRLTRFQAICRCWSKRQ